MARQTLNEVERIRTVYAGYGAEGAVKWSRTNRGNVAMVRERNACILALLREAGSWPIRGKRILDIGCGGGELLAFFESQGAYAQDLFGVDLLPERIEAARRTYPQMSLSVANAERLEFPDRQFDLVSLFLVFSSILDDAMAGNLALQVSRVLHPGGGILIYDFRVPSPANRHTRAVGRGALRRLFPDSQWHARSLTALPPLARRLGRVTAQVYPMMAALPFLRTHNLVLLRPGAPRV